MNALFAIVNALLHSSAVKTVRSKKAYRSPAFVRTTAHCAPAGNAAASTSTTRIMLTRSPRSKHCADALQSRRLSSPRPSFCGGTAKPFHQTGHGFLGFTQVFDGRLDHSLGCSVVDAKHDHPWGGALFLII